MADPQSPQASGADGVLVLPLDGGPSLVDRLLQVAQEDGVRVVVLAHAQEHVIAGSTRNPSPIAPAGAVPAAGDGCRGEPGMTSFVMEALDAVPQPVIASLAADCDATVTGLLAACDIVLAADTIRFSMDGGETIDAVEAERRSLVTLAVAADELAHETGSLLRELAAKDADALRLTKQTLRSVASVPWPDIVAWNGAKVAELKALRAGQPSPQDLAVQSFLAGRSKPGLGT